MIYLQYTEYKLCEYLLPFLLRIHFCGTFFFRFSFYDGTLYCLSLFSGGIYGTLWLYAKNFSHYIFAVDIGIYVYMYTLCRRCYYITNRKKKTKNYEGKFDRITAVDRYIRKVFHVTYKIVIMHNRL